MDALHLLHAVPFLTSSGTCELIQYLQSEEFRTISAVDLIVLKYSAVALQAPGDFPPGIFICSFSVGCETSTKTGQICLKPHRQVKADPDRVDRLGLLGPGF